MELINAIINWSLFITSVNEAVMTQIELEFAMEFAISAGAYMLARREDAISSEKLDRTVVTDVDKAINSWFIEAIKHRFGEQVSVIGEEASARIMNSTTTWVIDPVDGTGEYIDTRVVDSQRTSCVGIAMVAENILHLSVVFNPFRHELFVASRSLGGTFLNGTRLTPEDNQFAQQSGIQDIAYDYCYWDGARIDARILEAITGRLPLGSYSAINQACDVARGKSAFAISRRHHSRHCTECTSGRTSRRNCF
ncbi:MAG TPA: inositol monophosphatase family protein [Candidatus Saccharimonadales bacterium]|nr:inositol monophosphatase family protein [Candidatus Saccharimonadales bacterium]